MILALSAPLWPAAAQPSSVISAPIKPPSTVIAHPPPVVSSPVVTPPTLATIAELRQKAEWRRNLLAHPAPTRGCFKVSFPDTAWKSVPCSPSPHVPYGRHRGGKPYLIGNGATSDFSAQLLTSPINSAIGSFDSVSSGISEQGISAFSGEQIANAYSLQLNTNTFSTALCSGALPGAPCQGWEQFIYANHGVTGQLFIQYWLVAYNTSCPSGWAPYTYTLEGSTAKETDCYLNAIDGATDVPPLSVASLQQVSLAGSILPGNDAAILLIGTDAYTVSSNDPISAEKAWQIAEYNVFGDGNGTEATFGPNSTIAVRTAIGGGNLQAPGCDQASFTGETNNLTLSGTPQVTASGVAPSIVFTETNGAATPAGCTSSAGGGGSTLQWVAGDKFVDWASDGTGLAHYSVGGATCVVHAPSCAWKLVGHNGKDHFFPKDAPAPAGVTVLGVAYTPFWPSNLHKTDRGSVGSEGSYGEDPDVGIQKSAPLFSVHWQNACESTSAADYTGDWSRLNNTYQVSFLVSVQNGVYVDGAVPFSSAPAPMCAKADQPGPGKAPNSTTYPQTSTYPVPLAVLAPSNGGFLPWYATFPQPGLTALTPLSSWTILSIANPNKFDIILLGAGQSSSNCKGTTIKAGATNTDIAKLYGTTHPPLYLVACTKVLPVPTSVVLSVTYEY